MTKREVRAAALSLLEVEEDDVLWDVGAGTGSVSVELALLARRGRVYAVERKGEALSLICANRTRFGAGLRLSRVGLWALAHLRCWSALFAYGIGVYRHRYPCLYLEPETTS